MEYSSVLNHLTLITLTDESLTMDYYPIFLDLRNRPCLVVGGGAVATRKIRLLLKAKACVCVVSPTINHELEQWCRDGKIEHLSCCFQAEHVQGKALVIATTDHAHVNQEVANAARALNVPVNVVDQPDLCTFISPALVDRNPLIIAISSAGKAPVLARQLRQRLEQWLPNQLGELAAWAGRWRERVKQRVPAARRRHFWEQIFFGKVANHWLAGRESEAQHDATELLQQFGTENQGTNQKPGEVFIVGAGPGNPDLLTLRAIQLMQQADVILYDRLVSDAVLERARRDAERIFVGKQSGCHHKTQDQIHQLMLEQAQKGLRVCRLKGGDPLTFGRGGEEMEFLKQHQIPYEVVPGITAATACAAYAGIPLTHRKLTHGVQFLTGHVNGSRSSDEWQRLAQAQHTLVFYMALERIGDVVEGLCNEGGAPADRPAAVVENGSRPEQRVITGTLADIQQRVLAAEVQSPALFFVSESCALAEELNWFHGQNAAKPADSANAINFGTDTGLVPQAEIAPDISMAESS